MNPKSIQKSFHNGFEFGKDIMDACRLTLPLFIRKNVGIFRTEVNARVFLNLFLGSFSHLALRWIMMENGHKADKMDEIDEAVSLLSRAITEPEFYNMPHPYWNR